MKKVKLEKPITKLYFLGIKGMGMSALALMARQLGYEVSGSDVPESFSNGITEAKFEEAGITVFNNFDQQNIKTAQPDRLIVSAAYGPNHVEMKAAKTARISILTQSEMLGEIMSKFESVGVSGVHGKTTTSALLAFILTEAGFSPSYSLGASEVKGLEANGRIGNGKYFVAEADEYRKSEEDKTSKFFDLPLKHVIITSIELDHPDVFDTAEQVYEAFYRLSSKIPRDGTIIACSDYPLIRRLVSRRVDRACLTYGFESGATYQLTDYTAATVTTFSLMKDDKLVGKFTTQLPGRYNALNCAAAAIMAIQLGVGIDAIMKAIERFEGAKRRFQIVGTFKGATVVEDFAHHPTALAGLLAAARDRFPQSRLIAVFQPHTYSRTGKLLKEFADSLKGADKVILLNIFASAREKSGYVTIGDLIEAVRNVKPDVEYRPSLEEVAQYLQSSVKEGDVILLIGAGNVNEIFSLLEQRKEP